MLVNAIEHEDEDDIIPEVNEEESIYDIAWYMARCPKCHKVFNMFSGHDSSNLICPSGHRL